MCVSRYRTVNEPLFLSEYLRYCSTHTSRLEYAACVLHCEFEERVPLAIAAWMMGGGGAHALLRLETGGIRVTGKKLALKNYGTTELASCLVIRFRTSEV